MNKPIQTEGRKKHRGDRRQPGAQDEMNEILAGNPAPRTNEQGTQDESAERLGNELPAKVEDTPGTVMSAVAPFPGSDREWTAEEKAGMNDALRQYGWKDGDAPLVLTGSEEVTRNGVTQMEDQYHREGQDPSEPAALSIPQQSDRDVSHEALLPTLGEIVITKQAYVPEQSSESRLDRSRLGDLLANGGSDFINPLRPELDIDAGGIPGYAPPEAEDHPRFKLLRPEAAAPQYFDFSKMPMPMLKVLVRKMPTSFTGGSAPLKVLLTQTYLSVHGLERGYKLSKTDKGFQHLQDPSSIAYCFLDGLKRERSKLFEEWSKMISTNGINGGTVFSAYFLSYDGPPTKNLDDAVDCWSADIYPTELTISSVAHDNTSNHVQLGESGFTVSFGGTVTRLSQLPDDVARLLAEQ